MAGSQGQSWTRRCGGGGSGAHSVYGKSYGGGAQYPEGGSIEFPTNCKDWQDQNTSGVYHPVYGASRTLATASMYGTAPRFPASSPYDAGSSKGSSKGGSGRCKGAAVRASHQQLSEMVHHALSKEVCESVQEVAHLEESWSPEEMSKRVVRYLIKGMEKEFPRVDWMQAVRTFVDKAVWSYIRTCREKAWCFELDLEAAVGEASVKIAEACDGLNAPSQDEVISFSGEVYRMVHQKKNVDDVFWEILEDKFPMDVKTLEKLFREISRSYDRAVSCVQSKKDPDPDGRVHHFLKEWIRYSLRRLRTTIEADASGVLGRDSLSDLFIYFLGQSTIPAIFDDGQPTDSKTLAQIIVHGVFDEWFTEGVGGGEG